MKTFLVVLFLTLTTQAAIVKMVELDEAKPVKAGPCEIRQATWVEEDGVALGTKGYHRWTVEPDGDLSFLDAEADKLADVDVKKEYKADVSRIKAVCRAGWTTAVVNKFNARKVARELKGPLK